MTRPAFADLHPAFYPHAVRFWDAAEAAGLDLVLVASWRDPARQAELYAQGRTKPGRIVTWARPGSSPHNATIDGRPASLAIDVAPRHVLRLANWAPADPAWNRIGEVVRAFPELEWGGSWPKKPDRPHVQLRAWESLIPSPGVAA